jgi:LPS-assembly lipoprotein
MRHLRIFTIAGLLALSGCGFSPVYGSHDNNTTVTAQLGDIAIDNISERQGQILRNDLIDRMYAKGRPASPHYRLSVKIRSTVEDLGIQADATSTRSLLNMYADYTLLDEKGKKLVSGTAHSVTSFNKLDQQFGTLMASEDASERTINEVSDQIVNRLSLYFAETPGLPASTTP